MIKNNVQDLIMSKEAEDAFIIGTKICELLEDKDAIVCLAIIVEVLVLILESSPELIESKNEILESIILSLKDL